MERERELKGKGQKRDSQLSTWSLSFLYNFQMHFSFLPFPESVFNISMSYDEIIKAWTETNKLHVHTKFVYILENLMEIRKWRGFFQK